MDEYEKYDAGELLRDRYLKVGDISEGSYGLVSVAKDRKHNDKYVAVKFIYPVDYKKEKKPKSLRPSSSPVRLMSPTSNSIRPSKESIWKSLYEEAQKEIKIHQILGTHPNISSLYDHFDSCLVLEYCSRGDLYEAIHNGKGPSTSQDIRDVFHQVLSALEFCHSHGVYHRDLKPENILIAEDWSIKLCDWGLATTTKVITNKSEFDIGSERYMAPELFDDELESYDASKIDIWSVGIILLTLVFHKNPFQVANYSDKRFLQFVGNREALFDIFSTMSADLFSVLRFCLNIDPTNRDLTSLKNELATLKYFTIDEEYWGSDYDEEEEDAEDELEFEDDDLFYKKTSETKAQPPQITTSDFDAVVSSNGDALPEKHSSPSANESDSVASKSLNSKISAEEPVIRHNHRADALLSSNTNLKPIPIGGTGLKNIRNTRKPFNVASYSQSSHNTGKFGSASKFNREDFFTPKSVTNHYMDKYGEQRFASTTSQYHRQGGSRAPQDGRTKGTKPRSWKRNYKKGKPRDKNGNGHRHQSSNDHSHNYLSGFEGHSNNSTHNGNRRKSRSFSTGKTRKGFLPIGNGNNSLTSTFHTLSHPTSHGHPLNSANSSSTSAGGKYIPPYLRSPTYTKSPVIAPLTEEIDNLSLSNDYDEVFHLEDDFELGYKPEPPASSGIQFKKPNFRGVNNSTPESLTDVNLSSAIPMNGRGGSYGRRNSGISSHRRPLSSAPSDPSSALACASITIGGGKYIPPYRRGSQSKARPEKKPADDLTAKVASHGLGDFKPSSVPVNGTDWLTSFKKDWSDYE